jgi:hypothetical protein
VEVEIRTCLLTGVAAAATGLVEETEAATEETEAATGAAAEATGLVEATEAATEAMGVVTEVAVTDTVVVKAAATGSAVVTVSILLFFLRIVHYEIHKLKYVI